MRAATYRIYDSDNVLLYVGSSCDPDRRVRQHRTGQPWGHDIDRYEVDVMEPEQIARHREVVQILLLRPAHNTVFNTSHQWSDRLLTMHGDTFRLEAAAAEDLEQFAIDERRRACQDATDRSVICDAFEWLAGAMRARGYSLLGDAMAPLPKGGAA